MRYENGREVNHLTLMHVGIFLIICSIITIVASSMYNIHINKTNIASVETTAQLVRFIEVKDEQETKYVPEFKYVVNNVEYFIKSKYETDEKLYKGNGLGYIEQIKYNPENPEQSIIIGEEPHSATTFIFIAAGTLLPGVLLVIVYVKKNVTLMPSI